MKLRSAALIGVAGAILGVLVPGSAVAGINTLVQNGSFETGDFSEWTQLGNTGFASSGVSGNFFGVNPTDGSYQAWFGPAGTTGSISQVLSSTGTTYNVSFDLYNFGGGPSFFSATLGSDTLITFNNLFPPVDDTSDPSPGAYTTYSFSNVAAGIDPALTFTFEQNPSYFLLDPVAVSAAQATPEPGFYGVVALGLLGLAVTRRGYRRD
jgi:MYXO-CTERM domain-containing protein